MTPIRVMLADDHTILREGLRAILDLQEDLEVVAEAGNGPEAVEVYRRSEPDVLVLDLHMPGRDGDQVIREITEHHPDARVLVLTTYDGDDDVYRSLKAGARGYLLKDTPREELLDAVRRVAAGERAIPPSVAAIMVNEVDRPQLTAREHEVLRQLADGRSNASIARSLYVSEGTVKTHVNAILRKLGASSRTEAVSVALRRGLVRLDSSHPAAEPPLDRES